MTSNLLELLQLWCLEHRPRLVRTGISLEFDPSSNRWPKNCSNVYLEKGDRGGLLILWETGESQVQRVDYGSGSDPHEIYVEIGSAGDLEEVMSSLVAWVSGE